MNAIQLDQVPQLFVRRRSPSFWTHVFWCRAECRRFKFYADTAWLNELVVNQGEPPCIYLHRWYEDPPGKPCKLWYRTDQPIDFQISIKLKAPLWKALSLSNLTNGWSLCARRVLLTYDRFRMRCWTLSKVWFSWWAREPHCKEIIWSCIWAMYCFWMPISWSTMWLFFWVTTIMFQAYSSSRIIVCFVVPLAQM